MGCQGEAEENLSVHFRSRIEGNDEPAKSRRQLGALFENSGECCDIGAIVGGSLFSVSRSALARLKGGKFAAELAAPMEIQVRGRCFPSSWEIAYYTFGMSCADARDF